MRGERMIGALLIMTGCSEFGLDPIEQEGPPRTLVTVTDTFDQQALPAVDLLFVVDDTASMEQEQAALAAQFGALTEALSAAEVGWQIGVVTTDAHADDGGLLVGSPWVLSPGVPDVDAVFAQTIAVGTDGAGPEAGLAAAVLALELAVPNKDNAGFRRPDAALHVVFVSDADDQSDSLLDDPVADFLAVLDEERAGGLPALASAIVGDTPSGCTSNKGTAQAGDRYHDVAMQSGGVSMSICAASFDALLTDLGQASLTYDDTFELANTPSTATVRVEVDDERLEEGWEITDTTPPSIVFEEPPAPGARIEVTYLLEVSG